MELVELYRMVTFRIDITMGSLKNYPNKVYREQF